MKLQRIIPTWFEAIGLFVLVVLFVLVGSTPQLLEYYGLNNANQVIKQGAGHAITTGLGRLDGLSFTASAVTFLVWAVVGILCFAIVQALSRVYQEVKEENQVSSSRYIHPNTFARATFWRQVALDFVSIFLSLAILIAGFYLLFAFVLPAALAYTQELLTGNGFQHLGGFVLGFCILYGWVLVLAAILKFVINRHRLTSR